MLEVQQIVYDQKYYYRTYGQFDDYLASLNIFMINLSMMKYSSRFIQNNTYIRGTEFKKKEEFYHIIQNNHSER